MSERAIGTSGGSWKVSGRQRQHLVGVLLRSLRMGVLMLLTLSGVVIFAAPLAWMISTALKPASEVWLMPPKFIPSRIEWQNFIVPWQSMPFMTYYRNTLVLVVFNIIGAMLSNSIVAYGFARLRFPGRGILFLMVLSTMMLPGHVTLIPTYVLFSRLGWINSFKPLIVPTFLGSAFHIFLLRQFFMTISPELDDAARIDGCGWLGIFGRVILPLARPALGVVAIFTFTGNWNNFFGPLIYLNSPKYFPIALGLQLIQDREATNTQWVMAMALISLVPVIGLFFIAQRYFIQGIVITGVKG
jgi:ABC-type glycerol-3-phosphate transport system permease component